MYTASTRKRILAYVLDQCVNFIFYFPLIVKVTVHWLHNSHEILIPWNWLFLTFFAQICYQVSCYYFIEGLPGQWLLGLKLVSVYHPEMGLSFIQCLIQAIGEKLKWLLGNALYVTAFTNRERRHLVNILAETRVVQSHHRSGIVKIRMGVAVVLALLALGSTLTKNAEYYKKSKFTKSAIHYTSIFK